MSEFDSAAVTGGHSEGSLVRSTGDLERAAADRLWPILERTLAELGLGPHEARVLMRQIAEAYMAGRADGINVFPPQADRALSAEGIAIALGLQYGRITPAPRARARRRASAGGNRGDGPRFGPPRPPRGRGGLGRPRVPDRAPCRPGGAPRVPEAPVGAHVRRHVIGVTLTVGAATDQAAQEIATRVLIDEMAKLELV